MKKLLLPYFQSCCYFFKDNFGLNSFLLLSFFAMSFSGLAQQGSGGPNVEAGPDITLECGEACTDLTAVYVDTGLTTDYTVTSIDYDPPFDFTGLANPISVNTDDVWSSVVNLPFDFCFFDEVYQQVIIGSNGVISFNTTDANGYCSYVLGEREALPNPSVHKNSIMLYHDINPRYGTNEIGWELIGEAPYRTLVVSFSNVPYFNFNNPNNTATSTWQMVLYEATNAIEFFIESKPNPFDHVTSPINGGRAVLGIQNKTGTQGYTPPGRNTSVWEATNEAWRFTPSGESNVEFVWMNEDGDVIGNEATINVCPSDDVTTYTAQATYLNCNGDIIIESDTVTVTKTNTFNVDLGGDQSFCDGDDYVITAEVIDGDANDATFLWSTGETTQSITVNQSDTYSVDVTIADCTINKSVTINFNETPNIDLGEDMNTCFVNPVTLDATPSNYNDPNALTYEWTLNGTVITGETSATLDITAAGTYGVTVSFSGCVATAEINVGLGTVEIDLGPNVETCFNEPLLLNATPSNYDASEGSYEWTFNGSILTDETNPTLYVTEIGTYGVTVTVGGCSATDSIEVLPQDDLEVSIVEGDLEVCPNEPHTLTATTSSEGATFQWFLNGTPIAGETNSTLEFSIAAGAVGSQNYSVEITLGGCTGTDDVDVRLYPIGNCVISQGISPNGDGYNDTLDLTFLNDRTGIKKLQIFNRLGTLVFDQVNYTNQWAGKTNDGNDLPTGTYFYVIELNGKDAVYGEQHTGWIYLNQEAN
jgi:gliding motility-associated-like protein